jgi:hypothetical protein
VLTGRAGFVPSGGVGAALGFGSGAAVADGVSLLIGDGHAPGRLEILGGRAGQVTGQGGVDGAKAGDLAGPVGQVQQGGQGDGQVQAAGEPSRDHARRGRRSGYGRFRFLRAGPAVFRRISR